MEPPRLEKIMTAEGIVYRITYAGMVKEHKQDWQAEWHYRQACDMYVQNLATRRSNG
jgi:hypothetical protein